MKTKQEAGGGRVQKREDSRNTEREREREAVYIPYQIHFFNQPSWAARRGVGL